MEETGKRQFECSTCATGLRLGFEYIDLHSRLGENNGRSQSVRSSTNDTGSSNHGEGALGLRIIPEAPARWATLLPRSFRRTHAPVSVRRVRDTCASTIRPACVFARAC